MHETGSSSTNSLDKFMCFVAEQSFCHCGFLLGSPRTGWRVPNNQTTFSFKALYSTEKKYIKLRNFNASAAIRALPTTTHAGWSPSDMRANLSLNEVGVMAATDLGNKILITKNKVGLTKVWGGMYIPPPHKLELSLAKSKNVFQIS